MTPLSSSLERAAIRGSIADASPISPRERAEFARTNADFEVSDNFKNGTAPADFRYPNASDLSGFRGNPKAMRESPLGGPGFEIEEPEEVEAYSG